MSKSSAAMTRRSSAYDLSFSAPPSSSSRAMSGPRSSAPPSSGKRSKRSTELGQMVGSGGKGEVIDTLKTAAVAGGLAALDASEAGAAIEGAVGAKVSTLALGGSAVVLVAGKKLGVPRSVRRAARRVFAASAITAAIELGQGVPRALSGAMAKGGTAGTAGIDDRKTDPPAPDKSVTDA